MLTQMSMKAGIEKFGQKLNDAFMKELRQLYAIEAMVLKNKDDMSIDRKH